MPPDQLTQPGPAERAVLAVLSGRPLTEAAAEARMDPANLSDALQVFQQAGREALAHHAAQHEWWHVYLHFADWAHADHTFTTHVLPLLHAAETNGTLDGWWYTRKHPCWRLRLKTTTPIGDDLDRLVTEGHLHRWWPGIYEPETAAFGGPATMTAAHTLFITDSREIQQLPFRENLPLGPRELSVLLCTTLMRAAGLEWYEQGDVWHHVITTEHRSNTADIPRETLEARAIEIRTLLQADTEALLNPNGPLAPAAEWAAAFHDTGQALAAAVQQGTLDRGLRQILSYHVIFHWNRLGLTLRAQSTLAWRARTAILGSSSVIWR
ncbi:thiopeptide-type bacteriocin biosynthesis protein [Streptomyces sp. CBMA29]|uniref:thiopeptide-type bacteriocin biosynthesis protein n=1 Tax=Streptomyces sp. CBMA29 TaxID=1896314 RepID=UPI001661D63A|nr:thiopeptide-type bacteriocin biosynthesis protein [Streptomyces sp. CBMA29]MBD0735748.1 methyltransferase [Streptomyces sp. CBMA29]